MAFSVERERLMRTEPGDVIFDGSEAREVLEVECAVSYVERKLQEQIWSMDGIGTRGFSGSAIEAGAWSARRKGPQRRRVDTCTPL